MQMSQNLLAPKRLAENLRLEQRVLHRGAWPAGLDEFPSAPMQRAKSAMQSLADEKED